MILFEYFVCRIELLGHAKVREVSYIMQKKSVDIYVEDLFGNLYLFRHIPNL